MADVTVTLTADEAAFVLNELHSQGHGQGSSKDDFEPECPTCTAADKIKAALADGVDVPRTVTGEPFVPGYCGMPGCADCEKHKAAAGVQGTLNEQGEKR